MLGGGGVQAANAAQTNNKSVPMLIQSKQAAETKIDDLQAPAVFWQTFPLEEGCQVQVVDVKQYI